MALDPCKRVKLTVSNENRDKFHQIDGDLSCNFSGPYCPNPSIAPRSVVTAEQNLTDYRLPLGTYRVAAEWTTSSRQGCFGPEGTVLFHVHSNALTIRVAAH